MALKIAIGQFNACVGDIAGNCRKVETAYEKASQAGADLLILPEMFICGYPPEDLLLKKHFLDESLQAVKNIAATCSGISIMVGFAEPGEKAAYNSLAVLQNGKIAGIYRKRLLPNYGVFDEKRYFIAGDKPLSVEIKGVTIAATICEDIWDLDWLENFIGSANNNQLLVNISASPFHAGKLAEKEQLLSKCATRFSAAVAYCNLVGGQDELVFDGRSMVVDSEGKVAARAESFAEDLLLADIETANDGKINVRCQTALPAKNTDDDIAEIYQAIVLGVADYVRKNGFKTVLIGLSGGVDSALTAAIAVDALGAKNVVGVTMPSKFNSSETITDAEKSAKILGIEFYSIPISKTLDSFGQMLKITPGWKNEGIAYENLQARIRGTILMSMSNKFGHLVLTTGNKSETSAGYSTLYGDTAGGFAVIKDVPKTVVYKLCEYINKLRNKEIIPVSVIKRPPSAELRDDQKDSDSLPDYGILDAILKEYVENEQSAAQIIAKGFDSEIVQDVIRLVDRNEYKRRQSPPGVKITPKALGRDRRMPITNRYVP
ncbi:MAG: NAD+ synthase [Anaerohalosphaeraceae bacterium]|nr:NAD+ synthase [Anaerohalosphaeraceae bacterium]